MAEHIQEILKTGDYTLRQKLLKKYPAQRCSISFPAIVWAQRKSRFFWSHFKAATVPRVWKSSRPKASCAISRLRRKERAEHPQGHRTIQESFAAPGRVRLNVADDEARSLSPTSRKPAKRSNRSLPRARSGADAKPSAISICSSPCAPASDKQKDIDAVCGPHPEVSGDRSDARARRK